MISSINDQLLIEVNHDLSNRLKHVQH